MSVSKIRFFIFPLTSTIQTASGRGEEALRTSILLRRGCDRSKGCDEGHCSGQDAHDKLMMIPAARNNRSSREQLAPWSAALILGIERRKR